MVERDRRTQKRYGRFGGKMKRLIIAGSLVSILGLAAGAWALDDWNAVTISDSVVSFGVVAAGETDSLALTLTNNLPVPVTVTGAAFEEDVFWTDVGAQPIPAGSTGDITVYFSSVQNVDYTDFLRIELDEAIRPLAAEVSAEVHYLDTYYDCTQNRWAEELKDSLTALIDGHNSVGYTTARDSMYGHIDNIGGWVECVYTGRQAFFNTRAGATANNFNCEHTWPQSFFSEAEPMRSDIFHLYPTDMTANSNRANLDFGIVTSATWSVGGAKLGTDSEGQTVFEPRDVHKGNVARTHFYFVVRYDGNYDLYEDPSKMEAHFRSWHLSDPVDSAEQQRNEDIYNLQNNRNPFIDHPELADRISSFFGTATYPVDPEIAVAPEELDLGAIGFSTTVHAYFVVVNTGNDTLHVVSIVSTDGDFGVGTASMTLDPEAYEYVRVTYTSGTVEGSDSTSIVISSDDGDENPVEIPVTIEVSGSVGIDVVDSAPSGLQLYQNYPNPCLTRTTITFELDEPCRVKLAIYDIRGRRVAQLLDESRLPAGEHQVSLSSDDLSPGVYYYRLAAGGRVRSRRMAVIHRF
jgi:endonuclease I